MVSFAKLLHLKNDNESKFSLFIRYRFEILVKNIVLHKIRMK